MMLKTCRNTECQRDNPQPLDAFAKASTTPDGRRGTCKACRNREHSEKYKGDFAEKRRAAARANYAANPKQQRDASRKWAEENRARKTEVARQWHAANPGKARQYDNTRRARSLEAAVEPVDYSQVIKSRPNCYLCGSPLTTEVHADHVTPLARGGKHAMSNLLPTHPTCNRRKGDRFLSELDWYAGPVDPFH